MTSSSGLLVDFISCHTVQLISLILAAESNPININPFNLMPIVALGTLLFNDLISVLSISITDWDLLMSSPFTAQPSLLKTRPSERTYFRLILKRSTFIVCELFTPRVLLTLGLEIFLIILWLKDDSSSNWGLLFCLFLLWHVPYSKSSSDVTMAILSCLCSKIYFIWCMPTSNSQNSLSMVMWSLNLSMRPNGLSLSKRK